jgi:hypothetical protein
MKTLMICTFVLLFGVIGIWGQETTPEATALPLTETFTSENGRVSFQYPEEWFANEVDVPDPVVYVSLTNVEATELNEDISPESGEVNGFIAASYAGQQNSLPADVLEVVVRRKFWTTQ